MINDFYSIIEGNRRLDSMYTLSMQNSIVSCKDLLLSSPTVSIQEDFFEYYDISESLSIARRMDKYVSYQERLASISTLSMQNSLVCYQDLLLSSTTASIQEDFLKYYDISELLSIARRMDKYVSYQEHLGSISRLSMQDRFLNYYGISKSISITRRLNRFVDYKDLELMTLDNVFDRNKYYNTIESQYNSLEELCDDYALEYPIGKDFLIEARTIIENIKIYFMDKVAQLLCVEDIHYAVWKIYLEKVMLDSIKDIYIFIFEFIEVCYNMNLFRDGENTFLSMVVFYKLVLEFSKLLDGIKRDLSKELEEIKIDRID